MLSKSVHCPVCNECLGQRNPGVFFMAKCNECNFFYSWEPRQSKPTAKSIKEVERKTCGCETCRGLGR